MSANDIHNKGTSFTLVKHREAYGTIFEEPTILLHEPIKYFIINEYKTGFIIENFCEHYKIPKSNLYALGLFIILTITYCIEN